MTESPLFARQPIFDHNNQVVAYELLFRHSDANYSGVIDGDQASSHVLLNTFGNHKFADVTDGKRAFINFTRNLLLQPPDLPRDKIVIEILEDINADDAIVDGLTRLQKSGYTLALDDYFINRDTQRMLRFAQIVKVDVLSLSKKQIKKYVDHLKPLKVTLLAEKIEDYAMLEECKALGFEYFQGYFLCKPEIIRGLKVSANQTAILRLISTINDENSRHDDIVSAVSSDAGLSYKIIKLVNSPAVGLSQRIESLSQAIALLGLEKIKNWANFILMANQGNKPKELSIISLSRAKFCEQIGMQLENKEHGQKCFTVGLLSTLDSFFNLPLATLLDDLNLSDDIREALLNKTGNAGKTLKTVQHYERGEWPEIDWQFLASKNLDSEKLNDCYLNSLSWATRFTQALN